MDTHSGGSISALRGEGPRWEKQVGRRGKRGKSPTSPSYFPTLHPESPLVRPTGLKFHNPAMPSLELTLGTELGEKGKEGPRCPRRHSAHAHMTQCLRTSRGPFFLCQLRQRPPVPQETSNSSSHSRSSHQAPGKMRRFIQLALRAGLPIEQSNRDGNETVRWRGHAGPHQAHLHSLHPPRFSQQQGGL